MTIAQKIKIGDSANAGKNLEATCFHCFEALPKFGSVVAHLDGKDEKVCCHGCKAAAEFISAKGLGDFYQHRARSGRGDRFAEVLKADQSGVQFSTSNLLEYTIVNDDGSRDLQALVQGLYCSSCSWLIEKAIRELDQDIQVRIELDAKRINLSFPVDSELATKRKLNDVFQLLNHLGYKAMPVTIDASLAELESIRKTESRQFIKRIAVAGFGMMQVMTYAVAIYLGDAQGIEAGLRRFLMLVSMLVATVVVMYSGKPFFENALNDVKNRHFGMDVPIALAIAGAYFPSVYFTLAQTGEHVYFDSAVMFVFFLLIGRFIEMRARHHLTAAPVAIMNLLPAVIDVERFEGQQVKQRSIEVKQVEVGDQMVLRVGNVVPFDARIMGGCARIDEALITGEARGVDKKAGDLLVAGSKLESGYYRFKQQGVGLTHQYLRLNACYKVAEVMTRSQRKAYNALAEFSLLRY